MKEIESAEEFNKLKDEKLLVADFSAVWCGPCKALTPLLDSLSKDLTSAEFIKIDIDEYADLTDEFNVASVPTIILFKEGKEVGRQEGLMSKAKLKIWIETNLEIA